MSKDKEEKVFPKKEGNKSSITHIKRDQAIKSTGRMPWHQEPKKDVTSCDKLRRGANILGPADFRMGEPGWAIPNHRILNT